MPAEGLSSAICLGPVPAAAVVDRDLLRKRVADWKAKRADLIERAADVLAAQEKVVITEEELLAVDADRPRFRFECLPGGPRHIRPCPWAMCRFNMFTTMMTFEQRQNSAPREPPRMVMSPLDLPANRSCVLDVVDTRLSGYTLEEVGQILGVTRERIRQVQNDALLKIKRKLGNTPEGQAVLDAIETLLQEEGGDYVPSFTDL